MRINFYISFDQSSLIPIYSTNHQLIELYYKILLTLDEKHASSVAYVDVSKTFDTVRII
jgi:hypothetical protein